MGIIAVLLADLIQLFDTSLSNSTLEDIVPQTLS